MNLFKQINKILNKIFPSKIDLNRNMSVDGNKISEEDLEYIKRAAIESIKIANRFILYSAEKDKDDKPRIVIHAIPEQMLVPILGLIAETHESLTGQINAVKNAKKLLNIN
jgi:hypothetical protein